MRTFNHRWHVATHGSVEALLLRYAMARCNVLLVESGSMEGLTPHLRRSQRLREELTERLPPDRRESELQEAEWYAQEEAYSGQGFLARMSRRRGYDPRPWLIAHGLTVTVSQEEASQLRGLVLRLTDARSQFRAYTWRGDLGGALKAEAAWEHYAAELIGLLHMLAGHPAAQSEAWLRVVRADIDASVETHRDTYRAQYLL